MKKYDKLYIGGKWVTPVGTAKTQVVNPCSEEAISSVPMGNEEDVDRAVAAARKAFPAWSKTTVPERMKFMAKIVEALTARQNEIGDTISREMGMPSPWSRMIQAGLPIITLSSCISILEKYEFEHAIGRTQVVREPIGVCGFITPWNYPLHQIMGKVAPALASGCTMVLKPSQLAPLNAFILAEIMDQVGVPAGVFNLVTGAGSKVGRAISSHPGVDMISLTGSTKSGVAVLQEAAKTIKKVTLELGGKSANILLEDTDFPTAVMKGVYNCFLNSGQTCTALTRMIVPTNKQQEVAELAKKTAESMIVGDAFAEGVYIGPLVDLQQQKSVQGYINTGIREGAKLITGGPERPEHLPKGFYVRPTVFADVKPAMTIAQEEIFGPVLSIIPYNSEEEAIEIANNSIYGLSGSVWSGDPERAGRVARQINTGQIFVNGADFDVYSPFGGYKQSGLGRERSKYAMDEFLEIKSIVNPS